MDWSDKVILLWMDFYYPLRFEGSKTQTFLVKFSVISSTKRATSKAKSLSLSLSLNAVTYTNHFCRSILFTHVNRENPGDLSGVCILASNVQNRHLQKQLHAFQKVIMLCEFSTEKRNTLIIPFELGACSEIQFLYSFPC